MTNHRPLKIAAFGLVLAIVLTLIAATIIEQYAGTETVLEKIYTSPWMIGLWALMSVAALLYLLQTKVQKRLVTFALHLSFLLILSGALVTHCFGLQGSFHIRQGDDPVCSFTLKNGETAQLPFQVALQSFELKYYEGTFSPMDYISNVRYIENGEVVKSDAISMNHIGNHHNYRFYQSGYDGDGKGTRLAVSYDPYGIGITYTGYLCLLLSMIVFIFQKNGSFRNLLRHPLLRSKTILLLLLVLPVGAMGAETPKSLSKIEAAAFGDLYVYYQDRICPVQTLARDFTIKIYGASTYRGLNAEQVLTGWFFFYDEWKDEAMIEIDDLSTRRLLGIDEKFARLKDFVDVEGYKLESALQESGRHPGVDRANEKFNLISMVSTGTIFKIYPYQISEKEKCIWYSLADKLPSSIPNDEWMFIRKSMGYVAEKIALHDSDEVEDLLAKIKKYQKKEADVVPSDAAFSAEKIYNKIGFNKFVAIFSVTIGLIAFFFYCQRFIRKEKYPKSHTALLVLMGMNCFYLTLQMFLRGYISGHLPLSNGFETMVFMSWCCTVLTLIFNRKVYMAVPFGFLLSGLSLLVAMMGQSNPQITQLMPVLQSPLLSIHVVVIMIAYSLLGFIMLNGITALFLHYSKGDNAEKVEYLSVISRVLLYPAVFLLTIGVFVGAVWANVSWGRYWGWDPKEVWALITMLIYSLSLHPKSLGWFRNPVFFHWFCVLAFASVLFTYLGVNFILGGMHSYA